MGIECRHALQLRDRHQGITSDVPNEIRHGTLVVGLAESAEHTVEQVMSTETGKQGVFLAVFLSETPQSSQLLC